MDDWGRLPLQVQVFLEADNGTRQAMLGTNDSTTTDGNNINQPEWQARLFRHLARSSLKSDGTTAQHLLERLLQHPEALEKHCDAALAFVLQRESARSLLPRLVEACPARIQWPRIEAAWEPRDRDALLKHPHLYPLFVAGFANPCAFAFGRKAIITAAEHEHALAVLNILSADNERLTLSFLCGAVDTCTRLAVDAGKPGADVRTRSLLARWQSAVVAPCRQRMDLLAAHVCRHSWPTCLNAHLEDLFGFHTDEELLKQVAETDSKGTSRTDSEHNLNESLKERSETRDSAVSLDASEADHVSDTCKASSSEAIVILAAISATANRPEDERRRLNDLLRRRLFHEPPSLSLGTLLHPRALMAFVAIPPNPHLKAAPFASFSSSLLDDRLLLPMLAANSPLLPIVLWLDTLLTSMLGDTIPSAVAKDALEAEQLLADVDIGNRPGDSTFIGLKAIASMLRVLRSRLPLASNSPNNSVSHRVDASSKQQAANPRNSISTSIVFPMPPAVARPGGFTRSRLNKK